MQEVESMLPCVEMVLQQTRRKPMFGQDLNTHLRIHKVTKQCCQNASYFSKVKVLSRVGKVSTLNSSYCILLYLIRSWCCVKVLIKTRVKTKFHAQFCFGNLWNMRAIEPDSHYAALLTAPTNEYAWLLKYSTDTVDSDTILSIYRWCSLYTLKLHYRIEVAIAIIRFTVFYPNKGFNENFCIHIFAKASWKFPFFEQKWLTKVTKIFAKTKIN
jgi:hypothetical protein